MKKSVFVTYVLWFLFGGVGAHKFYLGRPAAGGLYICMSLLFWFGVLSLSAAVTEHVVDAVTAFDGSDHSFPALPQRRSGVSVMTGLSMMAPLMLAGLYDLFTIPFQVHVANQRLAADGQGVSAPAGSTFRSDDGEAAFSAAKADELIARYIAQQQQSRTAAPAVQTRPAGGGAPTFGKRRR